MILINVKVLKNFENLERIKNFSYLYNIIERSYALCVCVCVCTCERACECVCKTVEYITYIYNVYIN